MKMPCFSPGLLILGNFEQIIWTKTKPDSPQLSYPLFDECLLEYVLICSQTPEILAREFWQHYESFHFPSKRHELFTSFSLMISRWIESCWRLPVLWLSSHKWRRLRGHTRHMQLLYDECLFIPKPPPPPPPTLPLPRDHESKKFQISHAICFSIGATFGELLN